MYIFSHFQTTNVFRAYINVEQILFLIYLYMVDWWYLHRMILFSMQKKVGVYMGVLLYIGIQLYIVCINKHTAKGVCFIKVTQKLIILHALAFECECFLFFICYSVCFACILFYVSCAYIQKAISCRPITISYLLYTPCASP